MDRAKERLKLWSQKINSFLRRHRVPVVGISSVLIASLVVQQAFFHNPATAFAALTNIRQEVNIVDTYVTAASAASATSSAIVSIDPSKYTGATFYFEIVASTSAATNATIALVNGSTGATAVSITANGTTYSRYRSTSFSIGATTDYRVRLNAESVRKGIIAARIVIIQNSGAITATQTQIEVGADQTYTSGTASGLSAPKYWKYTAANWDGSPTFYAEATYARTVDATLASSTTYRTSGTRNFTIPSTVASTTVVQLWGAGGAGGAGTVNTNGSGSGGAGGQYSKKTISGLAGLTKSVTVAATTTGGVGSGSVGADSTWDTNVVVAKGGAGGALDSGAAGTGAITNGVGDTVNAGGNGAAGVSAGTSGGGGEGGRSTGTGGSASGGTGGTGGDGGDGGAGRSTNGIGNPGFNPGGAGAGGRSTGNPNVNGGDGALGRAIISYNLSQSATTTITLQESDGTGDGFVGWADKITIISAGTASTPTRARSTSFTPIAGRNYRIAVKEGYSGATHAIYNAKIIVDQASSPTKLEPQYLLANKTLASGTGLQKYLTSWNSAEWTNSANTYTHQVDAANNSTSVIEVDTSGGIQVSGSVVTSPDNAGVSSSMTMPATGDLDMKATTNNSDIYASRILVAVTPDTTAPTPNPPRFTSVPTPNSTTQVSMTSVTLTDVNAVSYFFTATSSTCGGNLGTGRTDSGWQSGASYSDSGLQINRCYAYTVTGKDAAGNITATSTASTTYTLAAVPGSVTYASVGVTGITISNTENGNPASNPTTNFAVYASSTSDSRWNNKWVTSAAGTSTSPQWLSDAQIDSMGLTNLKPSTRYDFSVVARNQNSVLTATSTRTGTTTLADTAAPTPNPATFSSVPNDTSGTSIAMTATAASDVSTPISYNFTVGSGTCGGNFGAGGTSSGWQTTTSYTDTGLDINKCYAYTVQSRDALSNTGTASGASQAYTTANTPSAPTGSVITDTTFTLTNNQNSNPSNTEFTVHIAATLPSDSNWNGKYVNSSGSPSATAVWLTDSQIDGLVVTGLAFSTQYTVEVKARNGDSEETSYSTQTNITTTADSNAPTPNPPTFSVAPSNDSDVQISMIANAVTDPSTPVQYYFAAVTGTCGVSVGTGGTDSGWQTSTSYSDNGLQANKCYGYTLTARDSIPNTTSASSASVTYSSAAVPGQLIQTSNSGTTVSISNNANGNPASNPTTTFAVFISASTPTDSTWNNKYVDGSGNPSVSAVWLTDAQIDVLTIVGLAGSTSYTAAVKAKNQDGDQTLFGSTQTLATSATVIPITRLQGGLRLQGTRVY